MSNEEIAVLIQAGKSDLMLQLWEQVKRLVIKILFKYQPQDGSTNCVELDDLLQAGFIGMLSAVGDFDHTAGFAFATYLNYHLKNAARDALGIRSFKQAKDPIHHSLSVELTTSPDGDTTIVDTIRDKSMDYIYEDVVDKLADQEACKLILEQRGCLRPEELAIFNAYFVEGLTVKEIAERDGYKYGRANSLRGQALIKLSQTKAVRLMSRERNLDNRTRFHAKKGFEAFNSSWSSVVEDQVLKRERLRQRMIEENLGG